jgi:hypothetical protein
MGWFRDHMIKVAPRYGIPIFEPYCNLTQTGHAPKGLLNEKRYSSGWRKLALAVIIHKMLLIMAFIHFMQEV